MHWKYERDWLTLIYIDTIIYSMRQTEGGIEFVTPSNGLQFDHRPTGMDKFHHWESHRIRVELLHGLL